MVGVVITFGIYVECPVKIVKMIGTMGKYSVRVVEARRQTKFFSTLGNGVLRGVSLTRARKLTVKFKFMDISVVNFLKRKAVTHTGITKPITYLRGFGIKKIESRNIGAFTVNVCTTTSTYERFWLLVSKDSF